MARPTDEKLKAVQANIFPGAHDAVGDWHAFDWHRHHQDITADRAHSSQALAIDVFGTIKAAPKLSKTAVLNALARQVGLPESDTWEIELEWCDPDNLLNEPRPTQVDVLAVSPETIMVIECKFTEKGGPCSQTKPLTKGPAAGLPQCTGRYQPQSHPVSGVVSSCTLTGKGIGYWDVIPSVFALDPLAHYDPCPFIGESFQWMRNTVLAKELGRASGKEVRCLIAYAAGGGFATEAKANSLAWLPPLKEGEHAPMTISYQEIVILAQNVDRQPLWDDLSRWVDGKVRAVSERKVI